MTKKLYLETYSGISGDMFAAALLDLGADREALERALRSIPAGGFETKISRVQKAGIDCCDFDVILDAEHDSHDHDMAYLYGPETEAEGPRCPHAHGHEAGEGHCGHHHCHEEEPEEGHCCGGHGEGHCRHHEEEPEEGHCCGGHGEGHCRHHEDEPEEGHCRHHEDEPEEGHCCGGHRHGEDRCHDGGEPRCPHARQNQGVQPLESYEEAFLAVNVPVARAESEEGHRCPHAHVHEEGKGRCGHHHCHEEEEIMEEGHCCGHHHGEDHCGHGHEEDHHCPHAHAHGHHHHSHEHRNMQDCLDIIDRTDMTDSAKALAKKIFTIIGEAEAKAHNKPLEEVHFHEVGAVDSIVDIVAAAVLFDSLGVSEVIIPALYEGTGTIRCQHGILPVPVPATMNIVSACGIPLQITGARGEYVTPTGAAIAAAIRTSGTLPASFRVIGTGIGAGKREYTERTNILRAILIEETETAGRDSVVKLESDLDDCTGEILGYTLERLMDAGALDVHYTPVFMKKNRPGWEITVLCRPEKKEAMEEILFSETTTIGIREFEQVSRAVLAREEKEIETPCGTAKAKAVTCGENTWIYPEYETAKALAQQAGIPLKEVYDAVKKGK